MATRKKKYMKLGGALPNEDEEVKFLLINGYNGSGLRKHERLTLLVSNMTGGHFKSSRLEMYSDYPKKIDKKLLGQAKSYDGVLRT